jgi:hypothetical protein
MAFDQRPPTSGGIDPDAEPNLPIADASQAHDIPTGVAPSLAKLQDWTAWLRANGVFYSSPGVIADDITIGDDLFVTDDATIGDTLNVSGSAFVSGNLSVTNNASVTGTLTVTTAANINGPLTLGSGNNVVLSPARSWSRRNLRMCSTMQPADIDHINGSSTLVSGIFIHTILMNSTALSFTSLLEIDDLPDGQTITTVTVRTQGDGPAPATIARAAGYQVVRWTDETTLETMSSFVSDSHTTGDWTTAANQTLTITSHSTIDRSYRYGVYVVNHDVDNNDELGLLSVLASGTATSLRP